MWILHIAFKFQWIELTCISKVGAAAVCNLASCRLSICEFAEEILAKFPTLYEFEN